MKPAPKPNFIPVACLLLLGVLYACGGGGGGGGGTTGGTTGRPPVAPEPICSTAPEPVLAQPQVGGGHPNYFVPATSKPDPGDAGLRAHTNHIIYKGATRGIPPAGLNPTQVRGAYGVTGSGAGAIALVVAYNFPTALNDFNVFSTQFGLPTEPSGTATDAANTVFQVVYATGSKPTDNAGWAQEAALDIEWAHAMAPGAKIYLVEAASSLVSDLMVAVNVAKNLPGVQQVSMSFSSSESRCNFVDYNPNFLKSGVMFFAAAGDSAGEKAFPAMSYNVVSVGGTTLDVSAGGQWLGETTWASTGCGPSQYEPRPVYQDSLYSRIGRYRGGADISAVADPNTGVAVYCSTVNSGDAGWMVFGGTSASSPIVAGAVNAAGTIATSSQELNALFIGGIGGSNLHDITTGQSASFNALVGWDFPTGVGTPKNLAALIGP